jgi:hypothetical protein
MMEYMVKILYFIQSKYVIFCDADDILGSGGFVKCDIGFHFSKVEVNLRVYLINDEAV